MKIKEIAENRIQYLQEIVARKKEAMAHLPKGKVRACGRRGKYHYYLRKDGNDSVGQYVRDGHLELVTKMLQREYDEKVVKQAQRELLCLKKVEKLYPENSVEEVFGKMPKGKQQLIVPIVETEEQFLNRNMNESFIKKGFAENDPEYFSENKERMRSKSEVLIANMLRSNNIPYIYEKPYYLKGIGSVYPDFTILDVKKRRVILLEHLGMMDDPDYVNRQIRKIRDYQYNGVFLGENLLLSFESYKRPINIKQVEEMVRHALEG